MLTILLIGAIAGVAGAGAALLAGNRLFRQVVGPVRHAAALADQIAKGHYARTGEPNAPHDPGLPDQISLTPADSDELGALVTSLEALAEAARLRIESFGEITHEIRTPVAILEGYFEGLLDGHVKPSDETWAMLHSEASRVHRLVDELQALAKFETRQAPPDLRAVDPGAMARAALERLLLPFQEKGLDVVTHIPAGLPLVLADPDHTTQVLVNMLTNALRYTPAPGTVTLSVGRFMDDAGASGSSGIGGRAGAGEVLFRVADTGVGIAAEYIPHLFERFFRVDRTGSRAMVGQGLGLPVAKALVEAMGGRIWAESAGPGKGSVFFFTLLVSTDANDG
jgi:signal transduction histidine kinase